MAVKLNSELAAFFNTGDQPSETEFGHLIDTIQPPHVLLTNADTNLSIANHAFRLLVIPNVSATRTFTLPSPIKDTWFHFISIPGAADTSSVVIHTSSVAAETFEGTIVSLDVNSNTVDAEFGDGGNDDAITLTTNAGFDIWLHAKDTITWYIWGYSAGNDDATVTDA